MCVDAVMAAAIYTAATLGIPRLMRNKSDSAGRDELRSRVEPLLEGAAESLGRQPGGPDPEAVLQTATERIVSDYPAIVDEADRTRLVVSLPTRSLLLAAPLAVSAPALISSWLLLAVLIVAAFVGWLLADTRDVAWRRTRRHRAACTKSRSECRDVCGGWVRTPTTTVVSIILSAAAFGIAIYGCINPS